MHKPEVHCGVNEVQVCLLNSLSLEGSFSPMVLKITGRPITFFECVEADSVGAGKLNLTYENAEAVKEDYFYLPFRRKLN